MSKVIQFPIAPNTLTADDEADFDIQEMYETLAENNRLRAEIEAQLDARPQRIILEMPTPPAPSPAANAFTFIAAFTVTSLLIYVALL